jgi:large subunit ribosomal protein LP0
LELLDEYTQVLICAADNVGSKQLQGIRKGLRPDSVVLMGKNTMMKWPIRIHAERTGNKDYENLLPALGLEPPFLLLFDVVFCR